MNIQRLLGFAYGVLFGVSIARFVITDSAIAGILAAAIFAVFFVIGGITREKTDADQA